MRPVRAIKRSMRTKTSLSILLMALSALPIYALAHEEKGSVIIHMDEKQFEPAKVTIETGETVIFENVGAKPHWPASNIHPTHDIYPAFDPKKGIEPGMAWSFTFNTPGIWRFHDHIQAELSGTITVIGTSSPELAPERIGFWSKIKRFFSSIFSRDTRRESRPNIGPIPPLRSEVSVKPEEHRDPAQKNAAIAKDSTAIWSNDSELIDYIRTYGVTQTFTQLDTLEKKGFGDCHQTAHRAGRMSLDLLGTSVFKECTLSCHSGCFHGATEAYFKKYGSSNLKENLNTLCADTTDKPFYNHQCLHGMGHGLLAWTNYELPEALETCDLLSAGQASCWTGAFMENVVTELAGEGADEHVTKYKSSDPHFPCTVVDDKYKDTCYFLQTSRMLQLFGTDYKKIADECAKAPVPYRRNCFESMGRDVSSTYRATPARSIQECGHASQEHRISCLNGAVQDALWDISGADTAITFCTLLTNNFEKASCYTTIFERMNQIVKNQAEKDLFCAKVEKEFESQCRY